MEGKMEKKAYPAMASAYKLLEDVGQGVSATVYRAACVPFNKVVAIKTLDLDKCNNNLDEVQREAQIMSMIEHPNVVRAYCSFVVEHSLWVVMPYMAGGSCLHIMKTAFPDGFEEPVIATILKETLKALEYLHRHGHIHRDVKSGNILIDANGAIKLGDFGLATCLFDVGSRQRSQKTFMGTPCWMAPEVLEQAHGYDFKADIWSFGITALELAHGHAPFSKYPPMKVLLMTLQNAPPGLDYECDKHFSKSFKELIAMCLVKDPAKRPTAEKLLKHSFFKGAKSSDYVARCILDGLPPLWERVKALKLADDARLAQKKILYGEQEQRSQNQYMRDVGYWNFDVDDLKAQAALARNSSGVLTALMQPKLANGTQYISGEKEQIPFENFESQAKDEKEHLNFVRDTDEEFSRCSPIRRERASSGPLTCTGATLDHRPANGVLALCKSSGNKEGPDDKLKGALIQKKGRFRVTSEDVELVENDPPLSSMRRAASTQALSQQTLPSQLFSRSNDPVTIPVAAIMMQLQNVLHQNILQQELSMSLMSSLNPGEASAATVPQLNYQASKGSRSPLASGSFPVC
ncbi:hypothetical protein O6H91_20G071800 [Diphasiastrum complanatum]|uniref:Uncharacterized protein n=1 Tax=Diphasiastrum complanatum TaxID=34168 RepID=A0ACC2ARF9_DIPCM|nr:hypothetical protein O6H91_20G071800 [Diphasiastrum complanatum]